jgi:ligand-binding sensor domain-containing protein
MKILGAVILTILSFYSLTAQNSFLFQKNEVPVTMLHQDKHTWAVTQNTFYELGKNEILTALPLPSKTYTAVSFGNRIYLGTADGVKYHQIGVTGFSDLVIPGLKGNRQINKLAVDERGSLWIATEFNGSFELKSDGSIVQRSQISPAYTIVCTPGKVWIGTNLGLYELALVADKWTRYAEEGYSGFELPDNYVEKLFPDKLGNLWVVMPSNLVFLPIIQEESHFPTFDYVGSRENELYSICNLPNQSYLIATKNGVIALAAKVAAHEHEAQEEIYTRPKTKGYQALAETLGAPVNLQQEKVLTMSEDNKMIWFFTGKGCWSIKTKTLEKNLARVVAPSKS